MSIRARIALRLLFVTAAALLISGCRTLPAGWHQEFDVPMNYEGRERICLYNLERLQDAKQEWTKDTCAPVGSLCPSPEALADRYFRIYQYGRRLPWDDDTQYLPVNQAICPSAGHYIIGTVGERPKCSQHGDLLRDYDQQIHIPYTH